MAVPRVLVPLATGFEEIEAVTIVDVLRRAGVEVVLAGLTGAGTVVGSHAIGVHADASLADLAADADHAARTARAFDMIVLPGGEPGTTNLAADPRLAACLDAFAAARRPIGAICAAPRILAARGLLRGIAATSHPSVEHHVRDGGADYGLERSVRAGSIVTSRGPGTALEFALAVLDVLGLGTRAAELGRAMLVASPSPGHPSRPS